jgi:hypothetical protein
VAGKRKRPWVLVSYSPDETARCLLLQTRSAQSAHEAITRNTDVLRRPKRHVPDVALLLKAGIFQREQQCRDHQALLWVATNHTKDADAAQSLVRRLRRALDKKTIPEFFRSVLY